MISKQRFLKRLGAHIRELRVKKGLTQAEAANRIDKDEQSLQRVERGVINPSIYYLYELAESLEVEITELVDFIE